MTVQELDERGAELLAEFEIVDGRAKRKPIEATVLGTMNFLLGGIQGSRQSGQEAVRPHGRTTAEPYWTWPS